MLNKVFSRVDPIIPLCRDRFVLNLGGIGMGINDTFQDLDKGIFGKDWHLPCVKEVSKDLLVVDIQADKAKELGRHGYGVIVQSVDEFFDLKRQFDVVLAEEVIEHLQDIRVFMDNVRRHLKPDGLFIVTTPNPWAWSYLLQRVFFGKERTNDSHFMWFSEKTMRYLLKSHGFEVIDYRIVDAESESLLGKIMQRLLRWLPERFGINMIFVCRLKE